MHSAKFRGKDQVNENVLHVNNEKKIFWKFDTHQPKSNWQIVIVRQNSYNYSSGSFVPIILHFIFVQFDWNF